MTWRLLICLLEAQDVCRYLRWTQTSFTFVCTVQILSQPVISIEVFLLVTWASDFIDCPLLIQVTWHAVVLLNTPNRQCIPVPLRQLNFCEMEENGMNRVTSTNTSKQTGQSRDIQYNFSQIQRVEVIFQTSPITCPNWDFCWRIIHLGVFQLCYD